MAFNSCINWDRYKRYNCFRCKFKPLEKLGFEAKAGRMTSEDFGQKITLPLIANVIRL